MLLRERRSFRWICSKFSIFPDQLINWLEGRFSKPDLGKLGRVDGIVTLGGCLGEYINSSTHDILIDGHAERITETVLLARRFPTARLIYSCGGEAEQALPVLIKLGIEAERISIETRSRNTVENAKYSKLIAAPRSQETWLLVTSAYHMPRAFAIFHGVGFHVRPYPVGLLAGVAHRPASEKLRRGLKECAALLFYRALGYSKTLVPKQSVASKD